MNCTKHVIILFGITITHCNKQKWFMIQLINFPWFALLDIYILIL